MNLNLAIRGDLRKIMQSEAVLTKAAVAYAIKQQTAETTAAVRSDTSSALGSRVGNAWRSKVYDFKGHPVGFIVSKAPNIVSAFSADTVIIPKKGRFLAIPTNFNRAMGRKTGKPRVTPAQMVETKLSFVRPAKDGSGLFWFLRVLHAQELREATLTKKGKARYYDPKDVALAGGLLRIGGRHQRRVRDAIAAGAVPMFKLVPNVRLKMRLNLDRIASQARASLPDKLSYSYALLDQGVKP